MAGLFLNSYPLTLRGDVDLYEMRGAAGTYTRAELRELAGVSVWMGRADAFAYDEPDTAAPQADITAKALMPADRLSLWSVREGIVAHCRAAGHDAWIGSAAELHVIGLIPAAVEDKVRIEHALIMRVSQEDYIDSDAILTARHRAHWRCADTLADAEVAARAAGRRAVRCAGDGPASGRVVRVAGDAAVIEAAGEEITIDAVNYTIAINSAFIANWRGSTVLRQVRVTTGDLTATGKRNRHGVEDRFGLVGDAVRMIGDVIGLPGGAEIEIGRFPVAIRLEDA